MWYELQLPLKWKVVVRWSQTLMFLWNLNVRRTLISQMFINTMSLADAEDTDTDTHFSQKLPMWMPMTLPWASHFGPLRPPQKPLVYALPFYSLLTISRRKHCISAIHPPPPLRVEKRTGCRQPNPPFTHNSPSKFTSYRFWYGIAPYHYYSMLWRPLLYPQPSLHCHVPSALHFIAALIARERSRLDGTHRPRLISSPPSHAKILEVMNSESPKQIPDTAIYRN